MSSIANGASAPLPLQPSHHPVANESAAAGIAALDAGLAQSTSVSVHENPTPSLMVWSFGAAALSASCLVLGLFLGRASRATSAQKCAPPAAPAAPAAMANDCVSISVDAPAQPPAPASKLVFAAP